MSCQSHLLVVDSLAGRLCTAFYLSCSPKADTVVLIILSFLGAAKYAVLFKKRKPLIRPYGDMYSRYFTLKLVIIEQNKSFTVSQAVEIRLPADM